MVRVVEPRTAPVLGFLTVTVTDLAPADANLKEKSWQLLKLGEQTWICGFPAQPFSPKFHSARISPVWPVI